MEGPATDPDLKYVSDQGILNSAIQRAIAVRPATGIQPAHHALIINIQQTHFMGEFLKIAIISRANVLSSATSVSLKNASTSPVIRALVTGGHEFKPGLAFEAAAFGLGDPFLAPLHEQWINLGHARAAAC